MDPRRPLAVTLRVEDLAASLAFWHEKLRIPVKLRGEGWAELQTETVVVTLVERGDGPAVTIGYETDDLDGSVAWLAEHGVATHAEDRGAAPPGARRAARDPDGHGLEIVDPKG